MTAAVQELFSGLPANLAAECAALSDPIGVFRAKPEAPAFVLTCSASPSEHQRTHGLKARRPPCPDRLERTGKLSGPGLMDPPPQEPVGTGGLGGDEEPPTGRRTTQRPFPDAPRGGGGAAEGTAGVAGERLLQFTPTPKDSCCSEGKVPWLIQAGRDVASSLSSIGSPALLQSHGSSPTKVQVTPGNLSDPVLETQGMAADGTRWFSQRGEAGTRGTSAGLPPGSRECSALDAAHAHGALSGISTLVSLEPPRLPGKPSSEKGQLPGEEDRGCPSPSAPSSAARKGPSLLQGDGGHLLGRGEGIRAVSNSAWPAQPEEERGFRDASSAPPGLESKACVAGVTSGPSPRLSESRLEFGAMPWEERTDVEVACEEVQEEGSAGGEESFGGGSDTRGQIELLEEWASEPKRGEALAQTESSDELPSGSESEPGMDRGADHTYSCPCRSATEDQEAAPAQQSSRGDRREGKDGSAALRAVKGTDPEGSISHHLLLLRDVVHPSTEEGPGSSGSDNAEMTDGSLRPPRGGRSVLEGEEKTMTTRTLWREASSFDASVDPQPSSSSCGSLDPDGELREGGHLLEVERGSRDRTGLPERPSVALLMADGASVVDTSFAMDGKRPEATVLREDLALAQREGGGLGGPEVTDSLLQGDPPGTRAEGATRSTVDPLPPKEESPSAGQEGGRRVPASGSLEPTLDAKPSEAEGRVAEVGSAWSRARSPSGRSRSDLCLATETGCTFSGEATCEGLEAQASNKEGHGPGASWPSGPDKSTVLPWACRAGDSGACLAYGGHLDHLYAVCPAGLAHPGLSTAGAAAEADIQWTDGDQSLVGAKGPPSSSSSSSSSVSTPAVSLPQGPRAGDSSLAESDGLGVVHTVKKEGVREWAEEHVEERDLGKTVLPELVRLGKDPSKEGPEAKHLTGPPSPSAWLPSHPKSGLDSSCPGRDRQQGCSWRLGNSCPVDPDQPRKTRCQVEAQLGGPQKHPPNSLVVLDQDKQDPAEAALGCSALPWMFSERQRVDPALQAATRSAEGGGAHKEAARPRNESPPLQETRGLALPVAPVLLLGKGAADTAQPNTDGCSEDTAPQFTENPRREGPKELESPGGGLERAALEGKRLLKDQLPPVRAEEFPPDSLAAGRGDHSGVPGEHRWLRCHHPPASPPGQSRCQPDPPPLIPLDAQSSAGGEPSKSSFRDEVKAHRAGEGLGTQPFRTSGSRCPRSDEPFTGPSSEAPSSPRAGEPLSGAISGAGDGAGCLALEKDHVDSWVSEAASLDSAREPKETGGCSDGRKHGTARRVSATLGSPEPLSTGLEPSLGEGGRGSRPATDTGGSPGVLVQSLAFLAGTEATPWPLEVATETRLPWTSLLSAGASDPSGLAEHSEWHEGDRSHARPLFPRGKAPETLRRSTADPSGASTPGRRSEGRGLQAGGGRRRLAGKEPPGSLWGSHVPDGPVEATGASEPGLSPRPAEEGVRERVEQQLACGVLRRQNRAPRKVRVERFLRQRRIHVGRPVGSSSPRMSPEDLGQQPFLTRSWSSGREQSAPRSTLRGTGRPKPCADTAVGPKRTEGRSPSLGLGRKDLRPLHQHKGRPLPSLWPGSESVGWRGQGSRRALDSARRRAPSLRLRRQLGEGSWAKGPTSGEFEAPGKGGSPLSLPSLKDSSEVAHGPGRKPVGPKCPSTPLAVPSSKRATAWSCPAKLRGSRSSRSDPVGLSRRSQDPPLLRKLSLLADRLLAPPRKPRTLQPLLNASELLPVPKKSSRLPSQRFPETFSCVHIQLDAPWVNGGRCCIQMFSSQRLALYPLEPAQGGFLGLSSKAFAAPAFPLWFHAQTDPGPARKPPGSEALLRVSKRAPAGGLPARPVSGWVFSLLLSRSCLDVAPILKEPPFSSPSAAKARPGEAAIGQHLQALQTILALLSPGCSRLWAKKGRLAHRTPGLPKPTLLQFARGLKGLRRGSPSVSAGLSFSSSSLVPSSPGRVLSLWSQQGPSQLSPLLPACCCKGHPGPTAAAAAATSLRSSPAEPSLRPGRFLGAPPAVQEGTRWEPPFPAWSPSSCPGPERTRPRPQGLSAPEFQARCLDERDVSAPVLPPGKDSPLKKAESEKKPKKVSQIRIRKTIPRPDPNLTPMGLPRPKRLKKTEFSLEEIYTNQNYKSPPATRCLETIFEEPKERNGAWVSVGHQKRKRVLEFQDFTVPRKRRARSRVKVAGSFTRAQRAAVEGHELDLLLIQKLTDLETFFATQEEQQQQRGVPGS